MQENKAAFRPAVVWTVCSAVQTRLSYSTITSKCPITHRCVCVAWDLNKVVFKKDLCRFVCSYSVVGLAGQRVKFVQEIDLVF